MSLAKAVMSAHKKMKTGLKNIEVSRSENGQYIAEHHYHDYEHPKNGVRHVLKTHHELARHIAKHMGGEPDADDKGKTGEHMRHEGKDSFGAGTREPY